MFVGRWVAGVGWFGCVGDVPVGGRMGETVLGGVGDWMAGWPGGWAGGRMGAVSGCGWVGGWLGGLAVVEVGGGDGVLICCLL